MLYDFTGEAPLSAEAWPTTIIVDPEGKVRFHLADLARRHEGRITELLDGLTGPDKMKRLDDGTLAYCDKDKCVIPAPKPLERRPHDRAPRGAIGPEGDLWVAFESNRDGDENIYLRSYRDGNEIDEVRLTASVSDDYSPDVTVDREGRVWVAWVSDRDGRYDIFVRSRTGETWSPPEAITRTDDDAMRPSLTVDTQGRLWAAWYEWSRLGDSETSRDRNIYARCRTRSVWSDPVEVSPVEPDVDDHADPAIVALSGTTADVAAVWSLDYHPGLHQPPLQAKTPSIFLRPLSTGAEPGSVENVHLLGSMGRRVDLNPAAAPLPGGGAVTIWDSLSGEAPGRQILSTTWSPGSPSPTVVRISAPESIAITPTVTVTPDGTAHAAWAQWSGESWDIYSTTFTNGVWTRRNALVAGPDDERSPRYVSAPGGRVWLIYEERTPEGTVVKVR